MKPYIATYVNGKEIAWDFKLVLHNADIKKGDQCIRIKTGEKCTCESVGQNDPPYRPIGWFKTESGEMFDAIFGVQVIKGKPIKVSEKAKKFVKDGDTFDESEVKFIDCCVSCGAKQNEPCVSGCIGNNASLAASEQVAFIKCDKCETFH